MKLTILAFLIFGISISAQAAEHFRYTPLGDLYLFSVDIAEAKAVLKDGEGNEAEVSLGDTVGDEDGVVFEIDSLYIVIEVGDTRTRKLLIRPQTMRPLKD